GGAERRVGPLRGGGGRPGRECRCRRQSHHAGRPAACRQEALRGGGTTESRALRIPNPSSMVRSAFGSVTHCSPSTTNMYLWMPTGTGTTAVQTPSPRSEERREG